MKNKHKILLVFISLSVVLLIAETSKRYKHYKAVEKFDQIESLLIKRQKIDL